MKVTESRYKNRQLHIEDYLQMVSAEQKEYAEVFDYSKITEKSSVITDYWGKTENPSSLLETMEENKNKIPNAKSIGYGTLDGERTSM